MKQGCLAGFGRGRLSWRMAGFVVFLLLLPVGRAGAAEKETAKEPAKESYAPLRDYSEENRTLNFKKERAEAKPASEGASTPVMPSLLKERSGGRADSVAKDSPETLKTKSGLGSAGTVVFMVVVLGALLFCGLAVLKKILPGGKALFSTPALEILGRTHFDSQRYLALVRVGKRLLVVGIGPNGFSPVSEITDETEAADLMAVTKPKTAAGKGIFHRMFQSQLANAEREAFLAESGAPAVSAKPAAGEFTTAEPAEDLEQARARMQAQIRSLRENE